MLSVESSRTLFGTVLASLVFVMVSSSFADQSFAQVDEPICEAVPEDPCDVTTFAGKPTGAYGTSFSSNGFFFQYFPGQSGYDFDIEDKSNLRKSLQFQCDYAVIDLPNPREYVTLLFHGIPARVNFIAVSGSGNVVDETQRHNNTPTEGAEAVMLGPHEEKISTVYMHVVETSQCDSYRCSGVSAYLSDIRACDVVAN